MEILVFVKRVPATDSKIKVGSDGKQIDPTGVEFVLNPNDEFAVEEALKTKEKFGGTVTVLSVGSSDAQKELRTCLAMGADKAILLEADTSTADASAIAQVLAGKTKELGAQVVFCGKQAVDGDDAQVGPRVATRLAWACATDVNALELEGDAFVATRDIEGGKEKIEGKLPAIFTCQKGLNEPRYPNLKGIMAAKKKPLEQVAATLQASALTTAAVTPPPERPAPAILGEGADAVSVLIDKLKNEAKVI
ncbi:MAG: electron transfer flavoprotein subunit beta/FixA family protein [Planctomycetes bacterium]|nr:electron transfer flavoprotein subunit beta/FixA family protein [Planctomycetota bacterium]